MNSNRETEGGERSQNRKKTLKKPIPYFSKVNNVMITSLIFSIT